MQDQDCIFCKIILGEIPAAKVYEDADAFAFLDIHPVNVGHVLVMSKAHHQDFGSMPEDAAARLFAAVHRVAGAAARAVGAPAFNIHVNNGQVAGQVVMHVHVHVIPRFADDGLTHWPKRPVTEAQMADAAAAISAALAV